MGGRTDGYMKSSPEECSEYRGSAPRPLLRHHCRHPAALPPIDFALNRDLPAAACCCDPEEAAGAGGGCFCVDAVQWVPSLRLLDTDLLPLYRCRRCDSYRLLAVFVSAFSAHNDAAAGDTADSADDAGQDADTVDTAGAAAADTACWEGIAKGIEEEYCEVRRAWEGAVTVQDHAVLFPGLGISPRFLCEQSHI
jgi:hypothetical protein